MQKYKISLIIVFGISLLMAFGNTPRLLAQTTTPQSGGTMIDSTYADAQMFNPVVSSDSASSSIEGFIFEGMMTYDKDMKVVPELALSWVISPNKLDYTFYLRQDVYWHDGIKFTADDVIFTWDRILDPRTDTTRASMFELLATDNTPYEEIDAYTVAFHLKDTFAPMLNNMMFSIIPQHAYLNYLGADGVAFTADDCTDVGADGVFGTADDTYTFNTDPRNVDPIGTGPMMFEEWKTDDHVSLKRNCVEFGGPGYWHEHDAYLERYILRVIPNVQTQLLALENGEIDVMDLSSTPQEDIDKLIVNPNINVFMAPTFVSDHIAFQCDPSKGNLYGSTSRDFSAKPNIFAGFEWQAQQWTDGRVPDGYLVRQALNYGLDKEGLIQYAYPYGARNLGPMYLAQTEWYNPNVEPYTYNLEKANQLLDQAGYGATKDDPKRADLDFTISFNMGNLRREKTCDYARGQWEALGITVTVEQLEWVSMLTTHYDNRNFDAMSAGWQGGGGDPDFSGVWSSRNIMPGGYPSTVNPDGTWAWEGNPKAGGLNYMSYWNPEVDNLMDTARTESENIVRKTYYNQIQEMMVDDSPYIWLLAHVNMVAIDAQFHGFVENSVAGLWPEPVGWRNIYFVPNANNNSGNQNTPGFEGIFVLFAGVSLTLLFRKRYE